MLNLRPLYNILESEGVESVRVVFIDDCGNIDVADTDWWPSQPEDNVTVEPSLVEEIVGKNPGNELGLWEVAEAAAKQIALQTKEDWTRAEVEILVQEGRVDVEIQVLEYKQYQFDINKDQMNEV